MKDPIANFARRVEQEGLPVLAVEVYIGGKPAGSRRWAPDVPLPIYSHTKSFTAAAVGIVVGEGKLALDDPVARLFPEYVNAENEVALRAVRLRQLLTMSSGFGRALLMREDRDAGVGAPDYLGYLFGQPLLDHPGERFFYSNGDSHIAGAMAARATGRPLYELLRERVLGPLGIPAPEWERCPRGQAFGASGMKLRTGDMVKLGLCCLDGGRWGGAQLIPGDWVAQMGSRQIETGIENADGWSRGYGFQCWMCDGYPDAYRFHGAGGQISLMLPRAQALIGLHCDAQDMGPILAAVGEELAAPLSA